MSTFLQHDLLLLLSQSVCSSGRIVINYLKNCNSSYRINPLEETWFELAEFADHHLTTPLAPVARLLLTSDGSMTQMLESLLLTDVSMSIKKQETIEPEEDLRELAGAEGQKKALAREAWLTDGKSPLIYANSLIFAKDDEDASIDMLQKTEKPLGRMLIEKGVRTLRNNCRIGLVKSTELAAELGFSEETAFWSRHYSLSTDSGLRGIIFELFSPRHFEM